MLNIGMAVVRKELDAAVAEHCDNVKKFHRIVSPMIRLTCSYYALNILFWKNYLENLIFQIRSSMQARSGARRKISPNTTEQYLPFYMRENS